jgi:hypothetical protein
VHRSALRQRVVRQPQFHLKIDRTGKMARSKNRCTGKLGGGNRPTVAERPAR